MHHGISQLLAPCSAVRTAPSGDESSHHPQVRAPDAPQRRKRRPSSRTSFGPLTQRPHSGEVQLLRRGSERRLLASSALRHYECTVTISDGRARGRTFSPCWRGRGLLTNPWREFIAGGTTFNFAAFITASNQGSRRNRRDIVKASFRVRYDAASLIPDFAGAMRDHRATICGLPLQAWPRVIFAHVLRLALSGRPRQITAHCSRPSASAKMFECQDRHRWLLHRLGYCAGWARPFSAAG